MSKINSRIQLLIAILVWTHLHGSLAAAFENETGFEKLDAGLISECETAIGKWKSIDGKNRIDSSHAKTGNQCLHLMGGERSTIELELGEEVKSDGVLSFWAERWTSRAPFSFRVEKWTGQDWTEIYNGDKQIKVGREFLSFVRIPLQDDSISKLRFTVTSPEETGLLIDDVSIVPAKPMQIESVEMIPVTLPALAWTEQSALVKVRIKTSGMLNPISITQVNGSIPGSTKPLIQSVQPFFTGNSSQFRWHRPFGDSIFANDLKPTFGFTDKQELLEGDNFLWLSVKMKCKLDIDQTVSGRVSSLTFSNGETKTLKDVDSIQRTGVAVRLPRDNGVHTFRIPGLATTNDGTLIGVYDVRYDNGSDLPGNIDVGMSRSTDGGITWEPMKVIMDMGDSADWRGDGIGDPSVLVDRETGTIWVSATWSHGNRSWRGSGPGLNPDETGQWILVKSDDDGVTWSEPINITRQVKKPEWCFLLQGPGKGITMADGTLVLPAQYQDPPNSNDRKAHRLPHSTFIYSQDHGETWQTGTGAWDDTTEAQIVELSDGQLMLNCRNNRSSRRIVVTTQDLGKTWSAHDTNDKSLIEPGACMASLINVGRELDWRSLPNRHGDKFLLFSNPDSLRGRNHITIKASLDSGNTWPQKHQLLLDEATGAGYSCMTMIDKETVGILYEGSQAHMTFQRIKLADILNPPADQKTKNPALAN